jgi:hypothetical protein
MANYATKSIHRLHLYELSPGDLIAPNFKLYELTQSEIADRSGIDNRFESERELHAAVNLARQVLQPIRDAFGSFTPNSVYRSQALERVLKRRPAGWISTSQHTSGCACDVEIVGKPTLELAAWARDNLASFDQIICECYDPLKGPNAGWVHISLKPEGWGANRENLLSYIRDPDTGSMVYVEGLTASVA